MYSIRIRFCDSKLLDEAETFRISFTSNYIRQLIFDFDTFSFGHYRDRKSHKFDDRQKKIIIIKYFVFL